ncbi:hypothetical protein [Azohydromonas lata]|uniref:Uncharacterized protein n=1 Tax=Azohydromonas lata TaxID=45677 RepID=A0ABU5ILN6_9BURK|nr:hypothetical protein [Azohydromonas lata]MDZ5459828.1 hypothetical protein [Azohydromonas lata]
MKQNQAPAAPAPAAEQRGPKKQAMESSLAAAFDRMAQKSGFDNWKQLDREQPLPKREAAPNPRSNPDHKPEPPKISGKQLATGQSGDVSFSDFMKGTQPLGPTPKAPAKK